MFHFFVEIVNQPSSACVRNLSLKNFLAKLKIFWEPRSQVPILFAAQGYDQSFLTFLPCGIDLTHFSMCYPLIH